ncbi:vitamin K-dependent protein Z [Latimeria chalumnae]|uniref:Protein Z, vitamin K dependent plasma glycoprotein n=1 Tax=Latimeria chalumnae TaxID=7897 RepID=M3XKM2_LATCH|nr:PREDICTED: vitamin K-dependent protein Z [Latimeria chalumnae]|eukprot:XP_014345180.1 PREDICTED: vitamin K-dependent protein Z [Latimeria chalumnae]
MAAGPWAVWLIFIAAFVCEAEQTVFLSAENANKMFGRHKRAGFTLIEEILRGNLERECYEEVCVYEEAREVFEHEENTKKFWSGYFEGKQCSSNPCLYNGKCTDTIRSYRCDCPEGYEGKNCEFASNECHPQMTDGCQHYCTPGFQNYKCSCAQGYKLGKDEKSCFPIEHYTCGRLLSTFATDHWMNTGDKVVTTEELHCLLGNFPWLALLINEDDRGFCSGVILNKYFVLTAAECTQKFGSFRVVVGKGQCKAVDHQTQVHHVTKTHLHLRYSVNSKENDIVLLELNKAITFSKYALPICLPEKDFAEHILIPKTNGTVSGWSLGENETQPFLLISQVSYLGQEPCRAIHNFSLTNRMLCADYHPLTCQFTSGSPLVTEHRGTWFLTGIISSGTTEYNCINGFLFTKISRYIIWILNIMK